MRPGVVFAVLAAGLSSCSSSESVAPLYAPLASETDLPAVVSRDGDNRRVELTLTAAPSAVPLLSGVSTPMWTYNGSLPGPLIVAEVGDQIRVHFHNKLPDSTTIHWHGMRLPNAMDGVPMGAGLIAAGSTFTYEFVAKDPGLYWYHPHFRSDEQVNRGLYGAIVVRGPAEPVVDREFVLMLDDIKLKADGTIPDFVDDEAKMMGREGDIVLVNGKVTPTLPVRPGSLVRFRFVNAANGKFMNLAAPDLAFRVLGTDGGMFPEPFDAAHVLVAPGERYDVLWIAPSTPGRYKVMSDPYERGHESGKRPAFEVFTLEVKDVPGFSGRTYPSAPAMGIATPLGDGPTDGTIVLDEHHEGGEPVFTINGAAGSAVPPIDVPRGRKMVFDVRNDAEMDHPFHLHGAFFQVLATNGVPSPASRLVDKDTVVVPARGSVRLAFRFDEPGTWMYHCHILEHAEKGMHGTMIVP